MLFTLGKLSFGLDFQKKALILFMLFFCLDLSAQNKNNEEEWQLQYKSLIKHYNAKKTDSIDFYAEKLFAQKNNIHDSLKVTLGKIFASLKKNENEAFKYLNQTEKLLLHSKKNKNVLGWNYFYKAKWYYNNGFDKRALKYYFIADSVFTSINRKSFMSVMTKVGICDVLMKSEIINEPTVIKQVIPYIESGLRVSDSLGHKVPSAILLYKKGNIYFAKNDLENSEIFYRKSLNISKEINNNIRQSLIYNRLAKIALRKNLPDSAFVYQKKAVEKAKNINDLIVISQANLDLGILYNYRKNYNEAIKHLEYAKAVLQKSKFTRKEPYYDIEYNLAEAYFGKNEFKKGYEYLKSATKIREETQQIKNEIHIEELELKYQSEKKEQQINLLKSQNQLVNQQKINQRNQLLTAITFTSILGLFFFFLYRNRQKTTKKLQDLDKAKSNFFVNISHEFRTPLTMISGPLQSQLYKENLNEEDKSSFKMMHRNASRLISLVDQLLDISKIEAGSLPLKVSKNNAISFIGSLANGFTFKALQKEINYKVNSNPTTIKTYFDADILEKIVINLLTNAIKYTPNKGTILCDTIVKEGKLYLAVKNSGKGLSKKEIDTIFERFYQVDDNAQGVGIGLALVKELVVLHKGTITIESIPNQWTTFAVALPIKKESFKKNEIIAIASYKNSFSESLNEGLNLQNKNISTLETSSTSEKPILLIVDDNADIRTYLSTVFKESFTIVVAKDGQEGIDFAIEQIPDIIISDIMMPIKNGIELCNILKMDERTSHIPIILLTAKTGEEHEIKGIETGADDYITKPFNEKLLAIRVEKLIESRKQLQLRYSQEVILRPKDIAITSIDEQFLKRLQNVLDEKLVEASFSIEDFSKAVGMSRMQLHRKLKALTGLSASEFIRSQRLKLAAQLLKKSNINVSQVGYSVGFNDHAYFSKCFKNMFLCTPTQYSNSSKNSN